MPDTVGVEHFYCVGFNGLFRTYFKYSHFKKTRSDHLLGKMVQLTVSHSVACGTDTCLLGRKDDFIHISLFGGEFATDWKRPSDIRRISFVFTARVYEQKVSVVQDCVIVTVVKTGAVGSAGYDGGIGRMFHSLRQKLCFQHGLNLIFMHAGLRGFHRHEMGCAGNRIGMLHQFDFAFRLFGPAKT